MTLFLIKIIRKDPKLLKHWSDVGIENSIVLPVNEQTEETEQPKMFKKFNVNLNALASSFSVYQESLCLANWSKRINPLEFLFLFSKGGVSEFRGLDSGVEQLMKQLLKINWTTGANGRLNCLVLVLVKRARTARYLANYVSNCVELIPSLRGVRTTFIAAGHGGASADEGEALFCS